MKKYTFSYETEKTKNSYQVEIPENVVEFKVVEMLNGIFLQYVTDLSKKNKWATDIIEKYSRSLRAFHFDEILGISFVELSDRRTGFSKCSKKDRFNPLVGKAVAICRAAGEKVPDFI